MEKIQMVDLQSQHKKIEPELNNAIEKVIKSARFINGPEVSEFERNLETYLKCENVISCGNGTDALQIALMALDLKPGEEVITTTFSFISTAEVIALLGLTPVFVDVNPQTFNICPAEIKKAITKKTKAIIPVHLFGQCAPMKAIMEIANENNLFVIEDVAQALGADYDFGDGKIRKSGTIGHIGTTSFFPSKNLGCMGDGGAIITNNDKFAEKIRMIKNHGSKIKYNHEIVGVNSRLDTIQAAILNVKLKNFSIDLKKRRTAAKHYNSLLQEVEWITLPREDQERFHTYNQYSILVENKLRNELADYLKKHGIPSMVYYPIPLHEQTAFRGFSNLSSFQNSEEIKTKILSLPLHPEISLETIGFIVEKIKKFK